MVGLSALYNYSYSDLMFIAQSAAMIISERNTIHYIIRVKVSFIVHVTRQFMFEEVGENEFE